MSPVESLEARLGSLTQSLRLRAQTFAELRYGADVFPLRAFFWGAEGSPAVLVFAGVHGDEPAGVEASLRLLEMLADGATPLTRHQILVFPCLNPSGLADGTRANRAGQDINRQFHADLTEETAAVRRFLKPMPPDVVVDLHTDTRAQGFYLFELLRVGGTSLAAAVLNALTAAGIALEEEPYFAGHVGTRGLFAPTTAGLEEFHRRAPGLALADWAWSLGVRRAYSFEAPPTGGVEGGAATHLAALMALFAALEDGEAGPATAA